MNKSEAHSTMASAAPAADVQAAPERPAMPAQPDGAAGRARWSGGRIAALVIGVLLVLVSVGSLGAAGVALWADRTQRDAAGYVTTDVHEFSSSGSALVTERIELGSPGVDWLYSPLLLDEVRIRATAVDAATELFVGIGPSGDVDRYLAGVGHTHIADFWTNEVEAIAGGAPASAPETQDFWVASTTGTGVRTLVWRPANGSWTVVVMNADGRPGIDAVGTELGATMPALPWIGFGSLAVGGVFLVGGVLLLVGAIRRAARG